MKKIYLALALLVLSYCLVSEAAAETQYVKVDGTGDAPTIQAVLDSCMNRGTVLLANGIYIGDGNSDIGSFGKAITVRSESRNPNSYIFK
jgi:hypothetical protein